MESAVSEVPPLTIFLAEDHVAIRELLYRHLSSLPGYRVVGQTADGREVAAACARLKPQLLVLDLGLYGLDGIQVAKAVGQVASATKILIFSSHHDPATVRRALEAGVTGIVEKTAPMNALIKAIDEVGRGQAFFSEAVTQSLHRSFAPPPTDRIVGDLTPRELEVLQAVAEGLSNKEVSTKLGISVKTAENHRHNLMSKLKARNSADLTREAYRLGLIRSNDGPPAS